MGRASGWRTAARIVVVLAAAGAATWWWLGREKERAEEKYRTEAIDRGEVILSVTATGSISAVTTVQVGSQVSGIIARLHADFNSPVQRGQLLAELDPTNFEALVAQRRADRLQNEVQMRNAETAFRRQERLIEERLAAQSDFDGAKAAYEAAAAQVEQAEAALRQAETNLRYTKILSPIDGVVVDRKYDVGQTVAASFQAPTLFTIAQDLTKMQVQADVDQSDIGRVKVGQKARFSVDAYPDQEFEGKISQIRLNATASQNVITYPVILEVPNPQGKLRPLMTANVTIEVDRVADVLRVPNAALRFRPTEGDERSGPAGGAPSRPAESRSTSAAGAPARPEAQPPAGSGPSVEERSARFARPGGAVAAAAAELSGAQRPAGRREQTVYRLDENAKPRPVKVRTGISDGRFTQVVEGELRPGDRVVVGQVTSKGESTSMRPPGGGRMF